jgi:hypothetical protein
MKIYRDGKEFELTLSELMSAHEEYELDCMVEDVKSQYERDGHEVELTDQQIEEVANLALHNLGKNDSYFESYWMSVEYTLGDYINSLPVDEEEDDE